MNILVCNDDGIDAYGIELLASKLIKYGNVYVISPDRPRSAASHSIVLHKPIMFSRVDKIPGAICYKTSGVPADCVRLAAGALDVKFDIVFSGCNNGLNLGTDIIYSGTVAGAREAVIQGIPGIAISTDADCFKIVENELDELLSLIFDKRLYSNDYVLNINFPVKGFEASKGFKLCRQGDKIFTCKYKLEDGLYRDESYPYIFDKNSDTDVYLADLGYITLVPLKIDQTNLEALKNLKL